MILPSSRHKKRYIRFEVISEEKVFKEEIKKSIYEAALKFLGEKGFAEAGLILVNDNIIRVDAKHKDACIAALSLVREIGGQKAVINTLNTSGTIKKVKELKNKNV